MKFKFSTSPLRIFRKSKATSTPAAQKLCPTCSTPMQPVGSGLIALTVLVLVIVAFGAYWLSWVVANIVAIIASVPVIVFISTPGYLCIGCKQKEIKEKTEG
ncbi:MAG TPA: hypothetical protein VFS31_10805 [Chitinophagaceae bacterium]|nr:hypothetical protein [Chitinophagaceae bacterium]